MTYATAPASDHSSDVAILGFALAPDRVYHAPLLPTEETGREPLLPALHRNGAGQGDSHIPLLFTFRPAPLRCRVSIVSVALSLGFAGTHYINTVSQNASPGGR